MRRRMSRLPLRGGGTGRVEQLPATGAIRRIIPRRALRVAIRAERSLFRLSNVSLPLGLAERHETAFDEIVDRGPEDTRVT
jgi:hypothetical protein